MSTTADGRYAGGPERRLLILGARTFAPVVADLVSEIRGFRVVAFVENLERDRCQSELEGLPILWVDDIAHLAESHVAVCALGSTQRQHFIEQVAAYDISFVTLVHPSANVSTKSRLNEGTVVSPASVISAFCQVGRHVLVNRGALIGHNVEIGDYVTVGPGANIAGFCHIGEATYVGMGAVVLNQLTIGAHCVVAAGALVNKDVPDNVVVAGSPARVVKTGVAGL